MPQTRRPQLPPVNMAAPVGWQEATRVIAEAATAAFLAKFHFDMHRFGFCTVNNARLYPAHWRRAPRITDLPDPCPGCGLAGYTDVAEYDAVKARDELLDLMDETIMAVRLTGYRPKPKPVKPAPSTPSTPSEPRAAAPCIVPTYHDRLHNVYPDPPPGYDGDYTGAMGGR